MIKNELTKPPKMASYYRIDFDSFTVETDDARWKFINTCNATPFQCDVYRSDFYGSEVLKYYFRLDWGLCEICRYDADGETEFDYFWSKDYEETYGETYPYDSYDFIYNPLIIDEVMKVIIEDYKKWTADI